MRGDRAGERHPTRSEFRTFPRSTWTRSGSSPVKTATHVTNFEFLSEKYARDSKADLIWEKVCEEIAHVA